MYPVRDAEWIPGILHFKDERYYQRVAARGLLGSFPFRVRLEERDQLGHPSDFAIYSDEPGQLVAVGEMKLWMRAGPDEPGIYAIRRDIQQLANQPCGQFVLVLTVSPIGDTEQNIRRLLDRLSCADKPHEMHVFRTTFWPGGNSGLEGGEFAVVGVLLKANEAG
ncbi:MAG: hypothetical protein ACRD3T_08970 [Terriglobia bacterium]